MRRWLPALLLALAILATGPLGPTISVLLYQGIAPAILWEEAPPHGRLVALAGFRGPALGCDEGGDAWVYPVEGGGRALGVGDCEAVAARGGIGVVAGESLRVVDLEGGGLSAATSLPARARSVDLDVYSGQVVVGLVDGRIASLPRDDLALGPPELIAVGPHPILDLVSAGEVTVAVDGAAVHLADWSAGAVRSSLASEGGAFGLERFGPSFYVAAGEGGVGALDLADLDAPAWGARADLGVEVTGVSLTNGYHLFAHHEGGARPVATSLPGVIFALPAHGLHHRLRSASGRSPEMWALSTEGTALRIDPAAGRELVRFAVGLLGLVLVATLAVVIARWRPADWRRRLVALVAGLAGIAWLLWDVGVRPIEALHIVEYAAFAGLVYRALAQRGSGAATVALGLLAGVAMGLVDEGAQWLLPTRTGALEDVELDAWAGLFGVILVGGAWVRSSAPRRGWSAPLALAGGLVLWIAGFQVLTVGFGQQFTDGPVTVTSRLSPEELRASDAARSAEVGELLSRAAMMGYSDFLAAYPAREDPFLYEFRVHAYRRDKYYGKRDMEVACGEMAILERYWARTEAASPFAWRPSQVALCEDFEGPYVSPVSADIMTRVGPPSLWGLAGLLALLALGGAALSARRRGGRTPGGGGSRAR